MPLNIEVKPNYRQKSSRLAWKPTRYTRKYVAFNLFRERFLKRKRFEDIVKDLHYPRKQIEFRLHCTISIKMRSKIEVKPTHRQKSSRLTWKPTRYTCKYVAFNSFWEVFLKSKRFEVRLQDLHFKRKQIKFRTNKSTLTLTRKKYCRVATLRALICPPLKQVYSQSIGFFKIKL